MIVAIRSINDQQRAADEVALVVRKFCMLSLDTDLVIHTQPEIAPLCLTG